MPWKIKKTTNLTDPQNPIIHLHDQSVNVNMVTHLDSGVVDLWIGHDDPKQAGVYITIDSERTPLLQLEETTGKPQGLDLAVMRTVLVTLGQNPTPLLGRFYKNARRPFHNQHRGHGTRLKSHEA